MYYYYCYCIIIIVIIVLLLLYYYYCIIIVIIVFVGRRSVGVSSEQVYGLMLYITDLFSSVMLDEMISVGFCLTISPNTYSGHLTSEERADTSLG